MNMADLATVTVGYGPSGVALPDLIEDWCARVLKIYEDQLTDPNAASTWTLHDLIGSYHLRSVIDRVLPRPPATDVPTYFPAPLRVGDELLKLSTREEANASVIHWFEGADDGDTSWWWRRIPAAGPIRAEYDAAQSLYHERR